MIRVDLVNEYLEGEPGSNLYFMGNSKEYSILIEFLNEFISNPLNNHKNKVLDLVEFVNGSNFKLIIGINPTGRDLCHIENDKILIDLPIEMWKQFIYFLEPLKNVKGHVYGENGHIDHPKTEYIDQSFSFA